MRLTGYFCFTLRPACFAVWMLTCSVAFACPASGQVPSAEEAPLVLRQGSEQVEWDLNSADFAVVVVDVWSRHWCASFTETVNAMAPAIGRFVDRMREAGATVVHAPGGIRNQFTDSTAYLRGQKLPVSPLPEIGSLPPLTGRDPFGGMTRVRCPSGETPRRIGYTVHPEVRVEAEDFVVFTPETLWNVFQARGISHVLYVGFAANNCVRGRPYGMLPMRMRGVEAGIVRDLTAVDFSVVEPPMSAEQTTDSWLLMAEPVVGPSISSGEVLTRLNVSGSLSTD